MKNLSFPLASFKASRVSYVNSPAPDWSAFNLSANFVFRNSFVGASPAFPLISKAHRYTVIYLIKTYPKLLYDKNLLESAYPFDQNSFVIFFLRENIEIETLVLQFIRW